MKALSFLYRYKIVEEIIITKIDDIQKIADVIAKGRSVSCYTS